MPGHSSRHWIWRDLDLCSWTNDDRLRWLDAPTTAPGWPNMLKHRPGAAGEQTATQVSPSTTSSAQRGAQTETGRRLRRAIQAACSALIEAEGELTEMDRVTGDGDLGASMKRAAAAVKDSVDLYPLDDISATLKALGYTLRHELGGSSGPLYGVLFLRCGNVLQNSRESGLAQWAEAAREGYRAISELGGAKPGDRTMLDALDPFVRSLSDAGENLPCE